MGNAAEATRQRGILLGLKTKCAGAWANTAGGLWSTPANWSGGNVADGANATADFSEIDITAANTTVHLDTARTIGSLFFGDTAPSFPTNNWILDNNGSAANILTLDVPAGPAPGGS